MTAEDIMTLDDITQELDLLSGNLSPLTPDKIKKGVDFYLNHHSILDDSNLEDELIKEPIIDPENPKNVTYKTYVKKRTKLCIPYPQQIVTTCSAFIMGKGINLVFNSDDNKDIESYENFTKMWNKSNIISALREATTKTLVKTRALILFFYDNDSGKIKCKVVCDDDNYRIFRHKDENGKMDAVVIRYNRDKIVDHKLIRNVDTTEIYMKDRWYRYEGVELQEGFPKKNPEGTDKLLIAYFEQEYPEFWFVMNLVDKQDYSRSQHSDVNTRIGNPAMVVNGEIKKKPLINDAVKIYEINPKKGKVSDTSSSTADMKYLEVSGAPESVKLELENNNKDIYKFTWPDLNALIDKAISGNLSSKSITLMFTHVFSKVAEKQVIWDEMIKRCISIMKNIAAAVLGDDHINDLDIDFKYNSVLPSSTDDMVNMMATAVGANLTTHEHAASYLDFNDPKTVKAVKKLYDEAIKVAKENADMVKPKNEDAPNPDGVNGQ